MSARKRRKHKAARSRAKTSKHRERQQRRTGRSRPHSHAAGFDRLRNWFLPDPGIFASLRPHGNTGWRPAALVWLALCWGWSEARNVTDAFSAAAAQCSQLGPVGFTTYQGFMKALVTWTNSLMLLLWQILQQRMQEIGGKWWQVGEWVAIAFDGSRSTAPRTESNEKAFCAANYGSGSTAKYRKKKTKGMRRRKNEKNRAQPQEPQAWITLLWHMGLRLPWLWRLGPSDSSERTHVMEMIEQGRFPKNTLFCGDAGFIGYPLWSVIVERGFHFLVRVGANVHLLSETMHWRRKGDGIVLCWPKNAMNAGWPPLRLRLVQVKIGKTRMWMLTSVLQPGRKVSTDPPTGAALGQSGLTKTQIARLYRMRWGVEVEFRGLKQTLDRAKLRCRNADRLLAELNWSVMAMAIAELFALKEQLASPQPKAKRTTPAEPRRRSLAQTMRALRWCLSHLNDRPEPGRDLQALLREAITDGYTRRKPKKARYCPSNPDKKPLGDPNVRRLTAKHKEKLQAFAGGKNTA